MGKKIKTLVLPSLLIVMLLFTACAKQATPYDGKWVATKAEALGVSLSVKEVFGEFYFTIDGSNKADFTVKDQTGTASWEEKDGKFILDIDGTLMEGEIGENTLTFDNAMDSGVKLTFEKEESK